MRRPWAAPSLKSDSAALLPNPAADPAADAGGRREFFRPTTRAAVRDGEKLLGFCLIAAGLLRFEDSVQTVDARGVHIYAYSQTG